MRDRTRTRGTIRGLRAFTLIELLAVCGIVSVLTALLLPVTASARRDARALRCQNNIRQLALAMAGYVGASGQKYPPNISVPSPGQWWYDAARVGAYVPAPAPGVPPDDDVVWSCPEDEQARRSYAMNYWASSKVTFIAAPAVGRRWAPQEKGASRLLLLVEAWSASGSPTVGYAAQGFVGSSGTPGQRFGGGGGFPPYSVGRFGSATCELPYVRHRRRGAAGEANQARGRVAVAFADHHVELLPNDALVDFATGQLTGLCLWSPTDMP
jgi:type II secretory pathway pseudopilin PulG